MKRIILSLLLLIFTSSNLIASTFDELRKTRKASYLDFILLKMESKLTQRHGLLGAQSLAMRIQYQSIGSQVDFLKEKNKIEVTIVGVMSKSRYSNKKYIPKIADCNILRNILLYGKYGYNVILQKRNTFLTPKDMEEIFKSLFLNNLSLSEEEKNFIINNTLVVSQIIDPVRGNNITCTGKIAEDLK